MHPISIYDMLILREYFAKKLEPTKKDKERAERLEEYLGDIVDGLSQLEIIKR